MLHVWKKCRPSYTKSPNVQSTFESYQDSSVVSQWPGDGDWYFMHTNYNLIYAPYYVSHPFIVMVLLSYLQWSDFMLPISKRSCWCFFLFLVIILHCKQRLCNARQNSMGLWMLLPFTDKAVAAYWISLYTKHRLKLMKDYVALMISSLVSMLLVGVSPSV